MLFLNYCIFSVCAEALVRCGRKTIPSTDCLLFR